MDYFTNIEKTVSAIIDPDFYIKLDAAKYKKHLTSYQCMLLYFMRLSRDCLKSKFKRPNIIVFDYQEMIICNRSFNIDYHLENNSNLDTNFRLEIMKDTNNERIYFMLQEQLKPEIVEFDWLPNTPSFNNYTVINYKNIINHIIKLHKLDENYNILNFELVIHIVNFKTGDWKIINP